MSPASVPQSAVPQPAVPHRFAVGPANDGSATDEAPREPNSDAVALRTVLLLRHARSTANVTGVLAGRSEGVHLDQEGVAQAQRIAVQLAGVHIARIVSSPLDRCRQTVASLAAALDLTVEVDERLSEVDYGTWTGRALKDLATEPLWKVVQQQPSAAQFPGGESLAAVSARAVSAVRELAAGAVPVLVCSHGDVLKAILADALGLHLDGFQRINVSPGSLSVVRYAPTRPIVERVNQTSDLTALAAPEQPANAAAGDAVVGGATR